MRRRTSADRPAPFLNESLRCPVSRLCGLCRRVLEAAPGSFDLGVGGTVAPRPRLGGGRRKLGDVKPNNGAGGAMNKSGALSGFRLRSQSQANCGGANPARTHVEPPVTPVQVAQRIQVPLTELYRPADPTLS